MDGKSLSSRIGDLVKFLSTVQGDLSNVTGPPSCLAPASIVESGPCWYQRPGLFVAPALEPDPAKRSLKVLRMILAAMRSQYYVAGGPGVSIKKPLNAFLGELFLASWTDSDRKARIDLVAEQVSHHPPITAMHMASREHGVRADGYARVEMTFSGSVNIRQLGHAVFHIDRYDEDYLIPLPEVKVRGFLNACLYPEVLGTYHVPSTTGYVSEITFSGTGLFRGKRNAFEARVYHKNDRKNTLFHLRGCWSEGWTVTDARTGEVLEHYDVDALDNLPAPVELEPVPEQDPWESRRAWDGVIDGLGRGDFRATADAKTKIEEAQRRMRAEERTRGEAWEPLFFKSVPAEDHAVFHRLTKGQGVDWQLHDKHTKGVWKIDEAKRDSIQKPYRGGLTPLG
ncbi:Oxysterol-binding -like protein [Colletotrichum tanaceti]|uniref:Oxysterol-binding-like protein n=1 Tax=Colletotrichum tanaceti TaxID=1306861 RepID=A0A4U6XL83_9PEZI|nr:Oxysterol-binding -like protein [Colletotrichum tanaceti]TKW56389.1 Oxysterol-binding -like protein [Colletotrichum tanaceti]